jgi:membrane-associated phospholipid phosphatase
MTPRSMSNTYLSRRTLLAGSLASAALASLQPRTSAQDNAPVANARDSAPATWRTWLLTSPDELRPEPPADPTPDELAELVQLQADRDDAMVALIQQWNSRPAVLPWTELGNAALAEFKMPAMRQSRAQGILQTAMYDAVIAAYDAQDAYGAPIPATLDPTITPLEGISTDRPAYPSEHAAVAGAAATVLTALLPDAAPHRFSDLADEAALTRLQVGLNVRRDIAAGLALGQAIGARAVAHGANDRPASEWDGAGRLKGDGYWVPTPPAFVKTPLEPLAPTWKLWVLSSADEFRPAPPPAYDSPAWRSQLAAVQQAVAGRTMRQAQQAKYWQGTTAATLWNGFASELISREGLDLPHAARVLALLAVAQADAQVACWEGKYTYWTERPITADAELAVLFPTPPFPSYPSAHATVSNAAAVVLSQLFPDDAADLFDLAEEAAASRCWAGIHYPMDDDAGTLQGRQVGYLVADIARTDEEARGVDLSRSSAAAAARAWDAASGYGAIEAQRAEPDLIGAP